MELKSVKKRESILLITFLILANVLDSICTDIGIKIGYIEEGNPFMDFIYNKSVICFYGIKVVVIPVCLLVMYYFFIQQKLNMKRFNVYLLITSVVYEYVLFLHLFWITQILLHDVA